MYTRWERAPNPDCQGHIPCSARTPSLCVWGRSFNLWTPEHGSKAPLPRQQAVQVAQHPVQLQPLSFLVLQIKRPGTIALWSSYQRASYIYTVWGIHLMPVRQWVMVLPISKSTFLSSELIPSHIPSFQLRFSRLASHSNVPSTFPYVQKCKSHNRSCNSSITNLCRWDCNQKPHSKYNLLEIPQDSRSPHIKVLCRRRLSLHTVT